MINQLNFSYRCSAIEKILSSNLECGDMSDEFSKLKNIKDVGLKECIELLEFLERYDLFDKLQEKLSDKEKKSLDSDQDVSKTFISAGDFDGIKNIILANIHREYPDDVESSVVLNHPIFIRIKKIEVSHHRSMELKKFFYQNGDWYTKMVKSEMHLRKGGPTKLSSILPKLAFLMSIKN